MSWLCKIFGHKWETNFTGHRSQHFGAIVVKYEDCKRCGKHKAAFTTPIELEVPK